MTYKHGAYAGLGTGFVAWLFLEGYLAFTPNPELFKNLLIVIGAGAFVLSVILGLLNAMRRRATFGTTIDGFVYGFMATFDVFYLLSSLIQGRLPFSIESIVIVFMNL